MRNILQSVARRLTRRDNEAVVPESAPPEEEIQQPPVDQLLTAYFRELRDAFDSCPPIAEFLAINPAPLHVDINAAGTTQDILITLPSRQCLHLHSLQLVSEGRVVDLGSATITASSHYADSAERVDDGMLADVEGDHTWAVHTAREKAPWVRIALDEALAQPATLIINNRRDAWARRAGGLEILTSDDGTAWTSEYTFESRDEFGELAADISRRHAIAELPAGREIQNFAIAIARGEYQPARPAFKRLPDADKPLLRDLVNEVFLESKGLEWASHGARRSFRFWTRDEKVAYIRLGRTIIEQLRELSPDVCFGFGSVLGPIRDDDLIEHDDDIDLIIAFEPEQVSSISAARQHVREFLEGKGYRVRGDFFAHWHVWRDDFKIDVFVGIYDADGTIGWYPGRRGALTRDTLFPPTIISLLGESYPIPRQPEKYLETIYTEKWRTPEPTWSHDWDPTQYNDIA
ncbi:hypothetical protein JL108_00670 [Aeromicrobium sp. YIM 150415]|uniref:hypothetical protein n=1 Tax=Aeromicrobium sp. YIM 150415 TaxID=2803912 RepID=UPI001965E3D4|nr:hypothetical protein [Aeromicrobium sp. YIM 150415]MBM9461938.1 hypothetical protein [Aeromicrobium sp. YIM 150415]